ncbi:hypothetical protein [Pseudomonas yangonensis]|uniref:hypothetical protein n=1 Tax=Pseudomonas yangonensis TaxID=2579922 RepID=UPI00137AAB29|nr:hypothetical protein [Pseudomonas yangonensis]
MTSTGLTLDAASAISYIGQTVLVELCWDDEPETVWHCVTVVGVIVPVEGVQKDACLITVNLDGKDRFPSEIYLDTIRTIRAMRHRDRHGSGNVLGRMTLTHSADGSGSRAALPARRNSFTVPSNGSTGAANP